MQNNIVKRITVTIMIMTCTSLLDCTQNNNAQNKAKQPSLLAFQAGCFTGIGITGATVRGVHLRSLEYAVDAINYGQKHILSSQFEWLDSHRHWIHAPEIHLMTADISCAVVGFGLMAWLAWYHSQPKELGQEKNQHPGRTARREVDYFYTRIRSKRLEQQHN